MEPHWWQGLMGGLLIGLSAAAYLLVSGRIAGMTGMLTNALTQPRSVTGRESVAFLLGAAAGPMIVGALWQPAPLTITHEPMALILGGLVVGVGVTVGNGCTSGHGVCGMSRASGRSIVATMTFMAGTAVSVFLIRHVAGVVL
jgi:uncharacterized membrane protein YedE/YeeE